MTMSSQLIPTYQTSVELYAFGFASQSCYEVEVGQVFVEVLKKSFADACAFFVDAVFCGVGYVPNASAVTFGCAVWVQCYVDLKEFFGVV